MSLFSLPSTCRTTPVDPHSAQNALITVRQTHFPASFQPVLVLTNATDIPSRFNASLAGLPGNDDSGAMASFTLFSTIGLFPNPGQNVYFITPPFFEAVSITSPITNRTATIRNINFDKGYKNIYIQDVKLNGQDYSRNWIGHEFFTEGWTLELVLGSEESGWGTALGDRPPSVSDEGGMSYMS